MKILKVIPLLLILTLFNSSSFAAENCDEIKGNITKKLFCKAKGKYASSDGSTSTSTSTEEDDGTWKIWKKPEWTTSTSTSTEEDDGTWKIWKKPEWMKKKN